MKTKLDMKMIQSMNLFERITGVKSKCSFTYNFITIFVVPRYLLRKALGENASNITRLGGKLNRKIRIVAEPLGRQDLERFVKAIIFPYDCNNVTIENDEVQVYSQPRTKAALIGRDKARLKELTEAIEQFFGLKKVVIK